MAEKAKLPRGIENFSRIHKEGFYYVDKTGLIRDFKKIQHMSTCSHAQDVLEKH